MIERLRLQDSNGAPLPKKARASLRAIHTVLTDPKKFGKWLGDLNWDAWFAFLKALRGEELSACELEIFRQCTGREKPPEEPFNEAYVIAGRRARKSAIASLLACFFALFGKWKAAPGETIAILIVAVSKRQAKVCRDFCEGILRSQPSYERRIEGDDHQTIRLTNGVEIICMASNFRSIRGRTVCCAILEEIAFWHDDTSANPDTEVYRAIKPSLATVEDSLLIGISSPYAKRGLLFNKFDRHYGKDDSKILIWRAPTLLMNPHVSPDIVEEAFLDDPIAAASEFNAEFRDDISSFLSHEAVHACIEKGRIERAPEQNHFYLAFCDFAGGSGKDSATLAIAHVENGQIIVDALRERRPKFSPKSVVGEFANLCRDYRIREVVGDRYAGEFPREAFRESEITYRLCGKSKNALYADLLPVINSGGCVFLDNDRLTNQLLSLERRTGRTTDVIDHSPGAHDDLANALAGVINECISRARRPRRRAAIIAPKVVTADSDVVDLNRDPSLRTFHDFGIR